MFRIGDRLKIKESEKRSFKIEYKDLTYKVTSIDSKGYLIVDCALKKDLKLMPSHFELVSRKHNRKLPSWW